MSVLPYPRYRDSGVEWVGAIPDDWRVLALKHFVSMRSGEQITSEHIEETGDYPVFGGNGLRGYTTTFTHDGDFALIGRQGALCGNINYGHGKFWASEHAVVVTPRMACAIFWLGELLRAMDLGQYSVTAAQPGLAVEVIGNLRIPLPSISEQSAIAAFLDHETAKIDALVAEQERLIALLKEKRQAVISHAVTKGLDPNAPMKDSGVEWLGQVPAHWAVVRIKYVTEELDQGWSPQCESYPVASDEAWGVLKVGCVNGGVFDPGENKTLPDELEPFPELGLRAGDILISRANTRDLVGSTALVPTNYPRLMLCDKLYRVRVKVDFAVQGFLVSYLGSSVARQQIELAAGGASSSMLNISQDAILDMILPLPSIMEQNKIIENVTRGCSALDTLISEATRAITLLRERRAALISAAVTGKIDVRGFGLPEQQAA